MRKSKNTKSRTLRPVDAAVICVCLLGTAAFLALFQNDLNQSLRRLNEEPVGFVASASRAALRRFEDRSIWDRLRKDSPVYNGDFIRTTEHSQTAIGFPGGALIGISESSFIRVFVDAGVPRIDVSGGNVSVSAGESAVDVSAGETRIKVAAGSTLILGAGAGEFNLQVTEGSASVTGPGGEEREAAAGTALVFDGTGAFSELPIAAAELPPDQIAAEPPAVPPDQTVAGPPDQIAAVPPAARPENARSTGPSPLPAVSGRKPEGGYVINHDTLRQSRTILFSWNPVAGADAYVFTLFRETESGGRQSIISFEGTKTSYTLDDLSLLDLGRFFWRVEAVKTGSGARRGTPRENLFTVAIPQPDIPRAGDPGNLYGR
ncbi:MAG: FecR domain-containing protein [Treponema sp.]|jgi:hypothetical protein|nr:FecR domain-containing protein [Treponema sp.]